MQRPVYRGKTEEDLHRWFALLSIPQSVTLLHWGKPVLDTEAQDLQVRPRERIRGEPHGDTLKGARVWNPTTKKVQEEAWAHQRGKALFVCLFVFCGGGYQERGGTTIGASFSRYMLSGSRALSTGVPVASMSCHCHL